MRHSIAAGIAAASAIVAGCHHERVEDAGSMVSRNYQVGSFDRVEVAGPYDVQVRTGPQASVAAQGGNRLLDRTTVEVHGDKLIIEPKRTKGWFGVHWSSNGKARFVVTVPQLRAASIAGSGGMQIDQVRGESFEGEVAGSGSLDVAQSDVQRLKLAIAGSGGIKARAGKATKAEYEIAGSGDVDGGGVAAQDLEVSIAGSGSVRAHATGQAEVNIMGSGGLDVTGGAKCKISKMGWGDVRCS